MRAAKLALALACGPASARETDKGDQEAGKETESDGPDTAKAE